VLQYRAELDATITFTTGGRLQAQAFQVDVPHPDVTRPDLAMLLASEHGLRDVERVDISAVRIFAEPRVTTAARQAGRIRVVDLSGGRTAIAGADVPIERLADRPGVVVRAVGSEVTASDLEPFVVAGYAVLLHTGGAPLTASAAGWLVERGAALVGIDSGFSGTAGLPVVEHLVALAELPSTGFRFTAVPPLGAGPSPVRAYAIVPFFEPHDHGRSAGWLPTTAAP
jgi:hypothetical protein